MSRAYEALTDGWRELLGKSSGALIHFDTKPDGREAHEPRASPSWNLMPAEIWETAQSVIIRLEVPGILEQDLDVSIAGNSVRVKGERRRCEDDVDDTSYKLSERSYGRFERVIPISSCIDQDNTEIVCENGVLTMILRKTEVVLPPKV